jgi:DNA-binding beta-propeller fold protein YncE
MIIGATMQKRKQSRLAAVTLALGSLGLTLALMLPGCDDDSTPINAPAAATTNATAAAPKKAATLPFIPLGNPDANLAGSFTDVTGPVTPDLNTAKVIQTLALFNHPDSCAASADGKYLFVTNSGAIINGITGPSFQYEQGAISKLSIGGDGRLTLVSLKFVDGLHAPMGMAILPKSTGKFPAGSLFVSTGTTAALDDKGDHIADIRKFNPGVSIFDPENGKRLGFIAMGPDRAVARSLRHPVLAPCGLCFDQQGNLYVADTANTGADLDPVVVGRPGLLRINNQNIDLYADNKVSEKDGAAVEFAYERHQPASIFYSSIDDGIYWTTLATDSTERSAGDVYRVVPEEFSQRVAQNVLGDTGGALLGITITPSGNLIASQVNGPLVYIGKKVQSEIEFTENGSFSAPADIKLFTAYKGYNVLFVPEQEPNSVESWKQRLRVVLLPKAL